MDQNLYDSQGYEITLEMSATYNPNKAGESEDTRDLGVLLCYLGAVQPACENITYEKDPYVLSRLEFPYAVEWNYQAVRGFYGPEENGTWMGPINTVYLKDVGIRTSGLKIVYYVPNFLRNLGASLRIFVNNELLKEITLSEEGIFTETLDVSNIGKESRQYLDDAHRILKILLTEFDRVCRKHGLRYYLICGSLLGVVRHGDLIPWDDDVDVAMPRKDFDRLLKIA